MKAYIITYDLHVHGQQYDPLIQKIKAYGVWCHIQGSVWAIGSSQSATQISDNLGTCLDGNDSLFVARLSGEAAWRGLSEEATKWLQDVLNREPAY